MNNLKPINFKNQNVITTELLAEVYGTDTVNIRNNFKRNKENFKEGKHYYLLEGEELKGFKSEVTESYVAPNVNKLYLWTERGANRHCKILDTDKAWEQFDNLEETYFKVKENPSLNTQALSPTLQVLVNLELENKQIKQDLKGINERLDLLEKRPYRTHKMVETFEGNPGSIVRRHTITEAVEVPKLYTVTEIAEKYGLTGRELNLKLQYERIQFQKGFYWKLCTRYKNKGYTVKDKNGNYKWTEKGKHFIESILIRN